MSHLQKAFIAKAKTKVAQSNQPQRMSRNLIMRQATHVGESYKQHRKDWPGWWYMEIPPDYLQFALRK